MTTRFAFTVAAFLVLSVSGRVHDWRKAAASSSFPEARLVMTGKPSPLPPHLLALLQEYEDLHSRTLSNPTDPSARYLTYSSKRFPGSRPPGLGDRLRGVKAMLTMAILLRRVLIIDEAGMDPRGTYLGMGFLPHRLHWRPSKPLEDFLRLDNTTAQSAKSPLITHDDSGSPLMTVAFNDSRQAGADATNATLAWLFSPSMLDVPNVGFGCTMTPLWVRRALKAAKALSLSHPDSVDTRALEILHRQPLWTTATVMDILFRPSYALMTTALRLANQTGLWASPNTPRLCSHVRTLVADGHCSFVSPQSGELGVDQAALEEAFPPSMTREEYRTHPGCRDGGPKNKRNITHAYQQPFHAPCVVEVAKLLGARTVFAASDSPTAPVDLRKALQIHGNDELNVVSLPSVGRLPHVSSMHAYDRFASSSPALETMGEMMLLSWCDGIVRTRSGFSAQAVEWGRIPHKFVREMDRMQSPGDEVPLTCKPYATKTKK